MKTDSGEALDTEGAEILTDWQKIGKVVLELLRCETASFKYKQLKVDALNKEPTNILKTTDCLFVTWFQLSQSCQGSVPPEMCYNWWCWEGSLCGALVLVLFGS